MPRYIGYCDKCGFEIEIRGQGYAGSTCLECDEDLSHEFRD